MPAVPCCTFHALTSLHLALQKPPSHPSRTQCCPGSHTLPFCHLSANCTLQKAALYHIFGFFWTTEFILGVGSITLAMVFVFYYFTRGDKSRLPRSPVWTAFKTVFRFHLGSVALASLIIAIVQVGLQGCAAACLRGQAGCCVGRLYGPAKTSPRRTALLPAPYCGNPPAHSSSKLFEPSGCCCLALVGAVHQVLGGPGGQAAEEEGGTLHTELLHAQVRQVLSVDHREDT